jgi:hypothetical protein
MGYGAWGSGRWGGGFIHILGCVASISGEPAPTKCARTPLPPCPSLRHRTPLLGSIRRLLLLQPNRHLWPHPINNFCYNIPPQSSFFPQKCAIITSFPLRLTGHLSGIKRVSGTVGIALGYLSSHASHQLLNQGHLTKFYLVIGHGAWGMGQRAMGGRVYSHSGLCGFDFG